jgi:hypothetical protein
MAQTSEALLWLHAKREELLLNPPQAKLKRGTFIAAFLLTTLAASGIGSRDAREYLTKKAAINAFSVSSRTIPPQDLV